jgi:hypothetical protein
MAVLHLDNVPEDLVREIEQLAQRERQTPSAKAVSLLREAVRHESTQARQGVAEILRRIRRNPIVPPPGTPDSVELLREDRER